MKRYEQMVNKHRERILNAVDYFWKNPETGYKEWKTNKYLSEAFEALGYELTQAGDIPGFYTDVDTGIPGPTVAVMGELDALICANHPECDPRTGAVHCCGHAAQIAALLGVAAALKEPGALDGLCGKIRLMAVPAEELIEVEFRQELKEAGKIHYFGGKVEFMYRGFFDDVDMAFMIHTTIGESNMGRITKGSNGCIAKMMEFQGVASHAGGSPEKGVNALYAANLALNAINALRETFVDSAHIRVHPIITAGGNAVNAIPDQVKLESYIRGATMDDIVEVNHKVNRALAASAAAMGANVHLRDIPGYWPNSNAPGLMPLMKEAMEQVLDTVRYEPEQWGTGCTDMGDLSSVMPTIHPYVSGSVGHSHGADYYITDRETACVSSAKVQLCLLNILLSNGAEKAKAVLAGFTPTFPKKADYFAFVDKLALSKQAVAQQTDGTIMLDFANR